MSITVESCVTLLYNLLLVIWIHKFMTPFNSWMDRRKSSIVTLTYDLRNESESLTPSTTANHWQAGITTNANSRWRYEISHRLGEDNMCV